MASNHAVKFNKKFKAFSVENKLMRGLLPLLQSTFYPAYSYAKALLGPTPQSTTPSKPKQKTGKRQQKGMRRGIQTDRQLTETVRWHHAYNIPASAFVSSAAARTYANAHKASLPACAWKAMAQTGLCVCVQKIWQTMRCLRLTPIRTQMPVAIPDWKLATAVDLLCKSETGELRIVEVKTGYETYYHHHTGRPMQHLGVADSPANQHQLQLFATVEMYKHLNCVKQSTYIQAEVWHLRADGIDLIPLQPWVAENKSKILQAMTQSHARA